MCIFLLTLDKIGVLIESENQFQDVCFYGDFGGVTQLGEHLACIQKARGVKPLTSTKISCELKLTDI